MENSSAEESAVDAVLCPDAEVSAGLYSGGLCSKIWPLRRR
jgi:hypothetical protein